MNEININHLPCGIIRLSKAFKIREVNRSMLDMSKITKRDWLNFSPNQLPFYEINSSPIRRLPLLKCFANEETFNLHKSALLKTFDGKYLLIFITGIKMERNNITLCVTNISKELTCSSPNYFELRSSNSTYKSSIVGNDEKIKTMLRLISMAAESSANVIITGESGTGKELVAREIHNLSDRKNKQFIPVNCSALTETLLESELFGHVKGAYTGAYKDKIGKFEAASGGTVFLDEIGEISPMLQVKLLRVIQEKTIERVGDNKLIKVNMRIITATNKNLRECVQKGLFREDLYYRLNVFPVHTIPLREHKADIQPLCNHFINKFNILTGKHIKGFTENAFRILLDYCWPGNVRELENSIEHAFVLCTKQFIDVFDLPQEVRLVNLRQGLCKGIDKTNLPTYFYADVSLEDYSVKTQSNPNHGKITKEQLLIILESNHWKKSETARQLGISRVALWKKMKSFNIK